MEGGDQPLPLAHAGGDIQQGQPFVLGRRKAGLGRNAVIAASAGRVGLARLHQFHMQEQAGQRGLVLFQLAGEIGDVKTVHRHRLAEPVDIHMTFRPGAPGRVAQRKIIEIPVARIDCGGNRLKQEIRIAGVVDYEIAGHGGNKASGRARQRCVECAAELAFIDVLARQVGAQIAAAQREFFADMAIKKSGQGAGLADARIHPDGAQQAGRLRSGIALEAAFPGGPGARRRFLRGGGQR